MQPYEASPKVTQRDMAHCGTMSHVVAMVARGFHRLTVVARLTSWPDPPVIDLPMICPPLNAQSELLIKVTFWHMICAPSPDSETESSFGFSVANMEIN